MVAESRCEFAAGRSNKRDLMRRPYRSARVLGLLLLGATSLAVLTPRRHAAAEPNPVPNVGYAALGRPAMLPQLDLRPECPMPVRRNAGEPSVAVPTAPMRTAVERAATISQGRLNADCRNPLDQ